MTQADLSTPRPARFGVALLVVMLHVAAVAALVRAFAPDLPDRIAQEVVAAFSITVATPPPPPPSPPSPTPEPKPVPKPAEPEGAAAPAGKKATPREVAAPKPKIPLAPSPAPKVAGTGSAVSAGAASAGEGTGAGGTGDGTGSGNAGTGAGGGGAAAKAVKIAGDINSARDYPRETRDLRIDDYVIVALNVGADGRVTGCRVTRASRDAQADAITCRLATERFRFRPATDAQGRAVASVYGWRQRWFYPGKKS